MFYIILMKFNINKIYEVYGIVLYCSDWVLRGCGWKRECVVMEVGVLLEV